MLSACKHAQYESNRFISGNSKLTESRMYYKYMFGFTVTVFVQDLRVKIKVKFNKI